MADIIQKSFNSSRREIKYLNRDFSSFKSSLIEYSKTYFPRTYKDFSEASPGMMFIELASYVGDVLSYYVDDTLKESLLPYAEDRKSVMALAQSMGYKPKLATPAVTTLSLYQLIPSTGNGGNNEPDGKFYLRIKEGLQSASTRNPELSDALITISDIVIGTEVIFLKITGSTIVWLVSKDPKSNSLGIVSISLDNLSDESPLASTVPDNVAVTSRV